MRDGAERPCCHSGVDALCLKRNLLGRALDKGHERGGRLRGARSHREKPRRRVEAKDFKNVLAIERQVQSGALSLLKRPPPRRANDPFPVGDKMPAAHRKITQSRQYHFSVKSHDIPEYVFLSPFI